MDARAKLIALYDEVVHALGARRLAREACLGALSREGERLVVPEPLPGGRRFVLGVGKVAAELMQGACDALGPLPAVLAVPPGSPEVPGAMVGGHPLPDEGSIAAGEALLRAASALGPSDVALLLLSGGGSALAEVPRLSLADLLATNDALLRGGVPIEEMNLIRAHLSQLKGGGLARALHRAGVRRAVALVAVDVPKGGAKAVSSGPGAADPGTYAAALSVVRARSLALPAEALRVLEAGARGELPETLKPGDPADFIPHHVLCDMGSPAREAAQRSEWPAELLPLVSGPLERFAEELAARLPPAQPGEGTVRLDAEPVRLDAEPARLVVASGEPELRIPADAPPGGRAQHLALLMARSLRGQRAAFLAAGTDGHDGATNAAGAAVDGTTWEEAERRGLRPAEALASFGAAAVLGALGAGIPARHSESHCGELYLLLRALP